MAYRIVDQPVSYLVYIVLVSFISVIVLMFGTGISKGFLHLYMGIVATSVANQINLASTFPDGSTVCVPIKTLPLIKYDEFGVIQSYGERFLYFKIKLFNVEGLYEVPIVPTFATDVSENKKMFYSQFLTDDLSCYGSWCKLDSRLVRGGMSNATYIYTVIDIMRMYPNLDVSPRYSRVYKIIIPTDKNYVCFYKNNGVLVVNPTFDTDPRV